MDSKLFSGGRKHRPRHFTVHVTEDEYVYLRRVASEEGASISALMEALIRRALPGHLNDRAGRVA